MPEITAEHSALMPGMTISRRSLFKGGLGLMAANWWSPGWAMAEPSGQSQRLSAFSTHGGGHFVAVLNPDGRIRHQLTVPSRGHGACFSDDRRRALFFARRPGNWVLLMDPETGARLAQTEAAPGRHFYGHGAFSHDQRLIYTSENDFENQRGVIGIYDAQSLKRLGEWDSHGIGPHEIGRLNQSNTLVVANGGILTHPDTGRLKLNLDTMRPSLTYLDLANGRRLDSVTPPHPQLSLRHLCVSPSDEVFVAAQFEGPRNRKLPLVFSHRQGQDLSPLRGQPEEERLSIQDYVASIALSQDGQTLLTSEPRGNRVNLWNAEAKCWLKSLGLPDIGGVSAGSDANLMMATSGTGAVFEISIRDQTLKRLQQYPSLNWDNHLV